MAEPHLWWRNGGAARTLADLPQVQHTEHAGAPATTLLALAKAVVQHGFQHVWVLTSQPSTFVDAVLSDDPVRDNLTVIPPHFHHWQMARQTAGLRLPSHAIIATDMSSMQLARHVFQAGVLRPGALLLCDQWSVFDGSAMEHALVRWRRHAPALRSRAL